MTNTEELEDIEDMAVPQPRLRLLRGGKGPPINTGGINWLNGLQKGAVFSCYKKGSQEDLEIYGISFKHTKTIVLFNGLGNGPARAVDPEIFCKKYTLHEILEEGGELPKEVEDDKGTLQSPRVVDDEDASGRQPEHEET